MTNETATRAYQQVAVLMSKDEDDDVTVGEQALLVHGRPFAFLDGDDLVVALSEERATDLLNRQVAAAYESGERSEGDSAERSEGRHSNGHWVRIGDVELWPELAREAHAQVGEPHVGDES